MLTLWPEPMATLPRAPFRFRCCPRSIVPGDVHLGPRKSVTSDGQSPLKLPPEVSRLLEAVDEEAFEAAWMQFLKRYSNLLLHTVHSRSDGYDSAMDRYAFILEGLRGSDCQRLRRYEADGRGRFTTWLAGSPRTVERAGGQCEDPALVGIP